MYYRYVGLVLLVLAGLASADTTWVSSGNVSGNWSAANSPYMIQGDVTVPTGDSLHIGPGVRVYFTGPWYFRVDTTARFQAMGAEGDSVVFTTDTLANPAGWYGLRVGAGVDTVSFRYCILEFMGWDSILRPEDFMWRPVHIAHLTARNNRRDLGVMSFGACNVQIDSCLFVDNTGGQCGTLAFFGRNVRISASEFIRGEGDYSGAVTVDGATEVGFSDCRFTDNEARGNSGACEIIADDVSFAGCIFEGNHAQSVGGALNLTADNMRLEDCTFRGNSAGYGGSVAIALGSMLVRNCLFENNTAGMGGAILSSDFDFDPELLVEDSRFTGNHGIYFGGAYGGDSRATWTRCVFDSNSAPEGGIIFSVGWLLHIERCTAIANEASIGSGAISFATGEYYWTQLRNNLFAHNTGASVLDWNQLNGDSVHHNLFFANSGGNFAQDAPGLEEVTQVNANGDSCDAYQNLFLDPRLADVAGGDYHLLWNSPCIDAGDPLSPRDPDSTVADIGAFFYDQTGDVPELPKGGVPRVSRLGAAYPNPFNAVTVIPFEIAKGGAVSLTLFDVLGREVAVLADRNYPPGTYRVVWDAEGLPSGVYFVILQAPDQRAIRKIVLLK